MLLVCELFLCLLCIQGGWAALAVLGAICASTNYTGKVCTLMTGELPLGTGVL